MLEDLLAVLQFVHNNNVIHRDIKPENIIRRKKDGKLVLVDFGAAKETIGADTSAVGTIIGSAAYIAPEQALGKAKFASDLYSLGATCLHLLTNIQPTELFDPAEGEWMWRDYLQNNEIDYELSHVLDKLVEGATKRRFQSVEEVLQALTGKFTSALYTPKPNTNRTDYNRQASTNKNPQKINKYIHKLKLKVAEWCADTWHDNYHQAPDDGSAWTNNDPKELRVLRGGSWLHLPGSCRSAQRFKFSPKSQSDAFGFRIASSV